MPRRAIWIAAAAGVAAALIVALGARDRDSVTGAPSPPRATAPAPLAAHDGGARPAVAARDEHEHAPAASTPLPALPDSLRGTEAVGGFARDAAGHLVPTPDALALFDYFLSASGEESLEAIRARILAQIDARLDDPAQAEAEALLDQYLAFREEVRQLAEDGVLEQDLEGRLQRLHELRRAHFGPEAAAALFGQEERTLAVDLERRRVALDPELDADARAAALAKLEQALPAEVADARARARAPAQSYAQTEQMREAGASEEEIFAARAARFGPEAAQRLAALDAQRADWDARLAAFRRERAELEKQGAQDAAAVKARLDALLHARFSDSEIVRVRAIEAL